MLRMQNELLKMLAALILVMLGVLLPKLLRWYQRRGLPFRQPWSDKPVRCRLCGWIGLGRQLIHDNASYRLRVFCPKCLFDSWEELDELEEAVWTSKKSVR